MFTRVSSCKIWGVNEKKIASLLTGGKIRAERILFTVLRQVLTVLAIYYFKIIISMIAYFSTVYSNDMLQKGSAEF